MTKSGGSAVRIAAWLFALACVALTTTGCALFGGVDGDFEPLEAAPPAGATSGAGGAAATCVDGAKNGGESDVDCGGDACSRCASGATCGDGADCETGVCADGACTLGSCTDGETNGAETDLDCGGGLCPPCQDGKACGSPAHCESKSCLGGVCAPASCDDGIENGQEILVDCGGGCTCAAGQPCAGSSDCTSKVCEGGLCLPATCLDGITNGTETDQDCGGACQPCSALQNCVVATDCVSDVCTSGKCQAATCSDGVENGAEADADCGAACGKPCGDGKGCDTPADCASDVCSVGICSPATCGDGVINGAETLVDCGGGCPCDTGMPCVSGPGCKSGVCASMLCQAAACGDGVKNGAETDADCGGACPACATAKSCLAHGDCQSQVCAGGTCQAPTCADATVNGAETDVDCGGPACAACAPGQGCAVDGDCTGNACIANACATSCTDGVKNQGESDVDCGGPLCAKCADGKACVASSDCASKVCGAGMCQVATCNDGLESGGESDADCGGPCPPCANGKSCIFAEDCTSFGCNSGFCGPWAKGWGTSTAPSYVAIGPDDNIVALMVSVAVDLGGGLLPNTSPKLAKFSATGAHLWSKELPSFDYNPSFAVDPAGNIIYVTQYYGTGGPEPCFGAMSAASVDVMVVKYSPDGACLWAKHFGGTDQEVPFDVAVTPSGDVLVVASTLSASFTFGPSVVSGLGSRTDWVGKISGADGTPLWARTLSGPTANPYVTPRVAAAPSGDVLVALPFQGTAPLGGPCGTLVDTGGPDPLNTDGFVAKLASADGACAWATKWGGPSGSEYPTAIAADPSGDVIVTGVKQATDQIQPNGSIGFATKLAGASGAQVWATGMPDGVGVFGVAFGVGGHFVVAGLANYSPVDFGGGPLPLVGGQDVFVVKYSAANGAHVASKTFGSTLNDSARDVAIHPAGGSIILVGLYGEAIDFGSGAIAAPLPPQFGQPTNTFLTSLGAMP